MIIGVVGGSGFIGSHIVDQLISAGHEVAILDIKHPHRHDVPYFPLDVKNASNASAAIAGHYNVIYMLAAIANVDHVYRNPVEAIDVNVSGVVNVLEACHRKGIARLILASSVWVYEGCDGDVVCEDTTLRPDRVRHLYTASKLAAEMCCHSYRSLYGQAFTILRYGIPYGPRARNGTVIATFVQNALNDEPIRIHGSGEQFRSFIYIDDLAAGNVAALCSAAKNETFNLEGPRPVTIREVAETVRYILGDQVRIEFTDPRPGDYRAKSVSNARSQERLGWSPRVDLVEGIRRYVEWLDSTRGSSTRSLMRLGR